MTQRKGKILFIGRYAGFDGGVERYEHTAALLLRRNGYKVYCAYQEEGREFENFSVAFRKMLPLEEVLSGSVEYSLIAVHKLSEPELLDRLLHKFKEKLVLFVHDHDPYCPRSYYYIPFGRRNCQRAYHPLVCSACAMVSNPRSWPNGVSGKLKHVLSFAKNLHRYREFPKVVVLSEFMRQNLLRNGFSESKIQLLSPYVESAKKPCAIQAASPPRLLFVGQLIRGKGVDLLLQIMAKVQADYRLLIAGGGKDRCWLETMAAELGIADKVEFQGWVLHPEKLYSTCDLLLLPTRWQEPFGLVGLEAASKGMPIVAFDLGGCREYIVHGENGILIPPGNIGEFAEKVQELLENPEKLLPMGEKGRILAKEKFSPEKFLQEFTNLIPE
jgi:glycosyltransferase involved in cell wall biosynthesis